MAGHFLTDHRPLEAALESPRPSFMERFLKWEAAGGILLMVATVAAIVIANTPLSKYYQLLLTTPFEIRLGDFGLGKPLLLWINDGLMAVFFFLVGLELKREIVEGELSDRRNVILPGVGALGGMIAPALIYVAFNWGDSTALKGWAIPAATDIAFALGVLSLVGSRVPLSIKIFLTSLAIFDDVGAIVIIALFYTAKIKLAALLVVTGCVPILYLMHRRGVMAKSPYILVGIIAWVATLKSGVHATLAGVLLAAFIPMRDPKNPENSPLKSLEHDLHAVVAFAILPIFAFANAGIDLRGIQMDQVFHAVPTGIALGLFLGKQIGVFGFCWIAAKMGIASLPKGIHWGSLYGASALAGIGFTMSLFIGGLAFEETGVDLLFDERIGIIIGSLASGVLGYIAMKRACR